MKRKLSMVLALMLCVAMVASMFAGCAGDTQSSSEPDSSTVEESSTADESSEADDQPKDEVTLDVITNIGSGLQETGIWWTDYLLEKTGVKLNIINGNDTDINTYIAADNLPDAFQVTDGEAMKAIITAGQAINFDDYADAIPNAWTAITEEAIAFQRESYGGDNNGVYFLPGASSNEESEAGGIEYGMRINLPYFEEYIEANGYPELKTLDDFIPVLKWIQEQHPTNEEGQSAYGMSFFTSWDSDGASYATKFMSMLGYFPNLWPVCIKLDDMSTSYNFDDDSVYYNVLKFMFNAQQAGIVDPDSLTQTWDDYCAKTSADRTYSAYCWSIPTDCKLVTFEEYEPMSYSGAWILGNWNGNAGLGVSSKSENIDRVLDVINFACDYDNVWYCLFGPQGEYWDVNDEGTPYITELGYQMQDDETLELSVGGNPAYEAPGFNLRLLSFYQTKHPTYGVSADTSSWAIDASKKTDIQLEWEAFCKEQYGVDLGDKKLTEVGFCNELDLFATYRTDPTDSTISDEMIDIKTRGQSFVPDMSWKMVYAADEAEFEALWDQLQADAEAIGMRELYEYECAKLESGEIWYLD